MTNLALSPTKQTCRHRGFSMIEVVLGLGLLAFGMISLAALFPAGLRANQVALGETYAAQHADQFLHLLKAHMVVPPSDDQDNWETYAAALPDNKPTGDDPAAGAWEPWFKQDVASYTIAGAGNQFFRVVQVGADKTDVQFSGSCRVWRSPIVISHYDSGTWRDITFSTDEAIALNVEISWPTEKPYASRHKSLYQIEVYRPEL
ncbi:MAG: hypothetical protein HN380_17690 [Victivallales bacterium]|jgi:Tfp pilus assembly protein PilV|nr:hypothetical protein [Victivallales bacterium]